jgi:hypothetical protein
MEERGVGLIILVGLMEISHLILMEFGIDLIKYPGQNA